VPWSIKRAKRSKENRGEEGGKEEDEEWMAHSHIEKGSAIAREYLQ